jgi:hypothetical protein
MCRRPTSSSHPREGSHLRQRTASSRHANGGGPRPETGPHHNSPSHRNLPRHTPCQPQQEGGKGRCPVVSNLPLHCAMQQRCHHASPSARSPSSPTMPRARLQRAATARQEKFQLPIAAQNFRPVISKRPLHSRAAAKMSPYIRIGPEPVLAAHARSPPAAGSHRPAGADSAPHCGTEFPHKRHHHVSRLIHTGLGSSSLIAHVLHSPPPPTRTAL